MENFMFFDLFVCLFVCVFIYFFFFSALHLYNSSTNSLITIGAYLTKKTNWCHSLMIMISHYGANATNVNLIRIGGKMLD